MTVLLAGLSLAGFLAAAVAALLHGRWAFAALYCLVGALGAAVIGGVLASQWRRKGDPDP